MVHARARIGVPCFKRRIELKTLQLYNVKVISLSNMHIIVPRHNHKHE
jgi:hypothetical protein